MRNEYVYVAAWCKLLNFSAEVAAVACEVARNSQAPLTAVFRSRDAWITLEDLEPRVRLLLQSLVPKQAAAGPFCVSARTAGSAACLWFTGSSFVYNAAAMKKFNSVPDAIMRLANAASSEWRAASITSLIIAPVPEEHCS